MKEKTPLSHVVVCVMVDFENSNSKSEVFKSISWNFLENYVTSEEAISHNILYHQPLPITHHQVRIANNYFE